MVDTLKLTQIGRYTTGVFDESAAEIPAYDPDTQRLFVVNANSAAVDVLDLSNPSEPTLIKAIDVSEFGEVANSVAVQNGIVAVAVEAAIAQNSGRVVFLNTDGDLLSQVTVGALPDMLTFTPDGTKVLVANEGEPSDDYTDDPEGSVSIIDLSNGVENLSNADVTTASFAAFNEQKAELIEQGVRIFGPDVGTAAPNDTVSVAQDLEPEYIAVTPDSTTAYVALQENNALAKVDISASQVTEILPLGFKDHNAEPSLETFFFEESELPVLGTTEARGDILLGGFSGLYFEGVAPNGKLQFITHPDRGPDAGSDEQGNRIFLLPELQPQLVRFELDPQDGLEISDRIFLTQADGTPLTGLPNLPELDPDTPIDEAGNLLEFAPLGADLEGVVRVPDGTYWLADEYRPSLYHFTEDGTLIERYVPKGLPPEVGTPAFHEVYSQRQPNRGFEAIAYQDGKVYGFIQSPIDNPASAETATVRILEFDPETNTVGEYLYIQDNVGGGSDKIGDAVALDEGEFLLIERDSNTGEDSLKNIYRINLKNATNVTDLPPGTLAAGETLESLTPEQLAQKGIQPVTKELYADLADLGYTFTDKPEGLALVDPTTVAVLNDNDFGETDVPIGLGLVSLNNALDASDEDGAIAIRNASVLGMYQPDGIAAYEANDGETYIVTANEGDAREYIVEDDQGNETETFVEEARVEDLSLDPEAFPDANLQQPENLGRLTVTTTLGDADDDGEYEQLYAFGGRSFSIFDTEGNLVFDSGSDFERITAEQVPDFFNSDNDENTFDTRSDNKGPEPEGVVLGEVNGRNYAFVGLERVGGVMVYDISDPAESEFVQYINTRDFTGDPEAGTGDLGPEGLSFISAEDSPNGNPLLAVAYEVSGSTAIFEITALTPIYDIQGTGHLSPLADEPVTTQGIVTAVDDNGFYLQDPQGDDNQATSDGILVFTGGTPEDGEGEAIAVGDEVQVAGTVSEFVPGGTDTGNLSTTEITAPTLTKLSENNDLPEAVVLGEDRTPPTAVIDDDGLASYDPTEDGIDFYESLEGMLVTVNDALSVSPTNRFGEIYTVANDGEDATGLSTRGTSNISPEDFNPERIQIQFDDDILPIEAVQVDVGAQLGDVTGVVGYSFGNYEVNLTEPFALEEASRLERETTALTGREQLMIATYNVLNLDPNDADGDADIADGQFEAIAAHIANNLQTPDIVALQEIQDNDGSVAPDESDVTAADETLSLLVEQIEEISDVSYKFIDNPFIGDDTNGGQPGGNIRNAFLYNPERVEFVEDSLSPITEPQDQQTNPENPFFDSRLPLVATFTFNGEEITLVNNHFSSKGGSSPLFGSIQPATELQEDPQVNGSVEERRSQAEAVATFVENLRQDSDANIAVLGDLNEFEFISPLEILESASLTNLTKSLPPNERYSYIFQGNSQSLDHILVSDNLAEQAEFDAVHVNSEFSEQASDHDPLVARLQLASAAPEPVFGTLNDDVFDAAVEDGFDGSADLVFAGAGDDLIDASTAGSGNNRLYGGAGDDIFFLGANDRVVGGAGKDRFFVLAGGGNTLTGGAGADQFWIATGEQLEASNTITDFDPDIDIIGIGGLGLSFSDLSFVQAKKNALISFPDGELAVLEGIQVDDLSEANFIFV